MRIALLACLLLLPCSCLSFEARGYGAYMQPRLSGDLALSPDPTTPAGLGVEMKQLGVDADNSPYVRADMEASIVNVSVSAFRFQSSGSGQLGAGFGGIPAGVAVNSDIDILNVKGAVTFDLLDLGIVRVSPGFAIDYTDMDFEVRQVGSVTRERLQVQVPAPLGYVQGEIDLGPVAANIDLGAMRVKLDQVDGTYIDFEAMLRYEPSDNFELIGGYRIITVDGEGFVDGQAYDVDVELAGWFIGGGFTF